MLHASAAGCCAMRGRVTLATRCRPVLLVLLPRYECYRGMFSSLAFAACARSFAGGCQADGGGQHAAPGGEWCACQPCWQCLGLQGQRDCTGAVRPACILLCC